MMTIFGVRVKSLSNVRCDRNAPQMRRTRFAALKGCLSSFGLILVCGFSVPLIAQQSVATDQTTSPNSGGPLARYILQPQDVLTITFSLSPELNQTVTIQPDGYISLQNAGSLYVKGMIIPQLVEAIKKAYEGVLHDPIVNVDLADYQKPFFTVSGQVAKPGQYELRSDLKVSDALAIAGGMTMITAKTQVFLFRRSSGDWYQVTSLNFKKIYNGKDLAADVSLQPGDMIYVPEKFIANFRKYVPYSFTGGTYVTPVP